MRKYKTKKDILWQLPIVMLIPKGTVGEEVITKEGIIFKKEYRHYRFVSPTGEYLALPAGFVENTPSYFERIEEIA